MENIAGLFKTVREDVGVAGEGGLRERLPACACTARAAIWYNLLAASRGA